MGSNRDNVKDAVCDWCIEHSYDEKGKLCARCNISSMVDAIPSADLNLEQICTQLLTSREDLLT